MSSFFYKQNDIISSADDILSMNPGELLLLKNFELINYLSEYPDIAVYSQKLFNEFKKISKIKPYKDIPVLIQGETGTGKEVMSGFIASNGTKNSFVGLNCSNLSRELFESELFGYEKNSFTGASATGKDGKLHEARGGVLFLDEFTEIPFDMQSKLLRVLQEREFYKVGGNKKEQVEARILFATNKNVLDLVKKGEFREDLYYRINLCEIKIPPLRDRAEEIIPLTISFIQKINDEYNKNIQSIEAGLLQKLQNYTFPGNVRELKNIISRLVIFEEGNTIFSENIKLFESGGNISLNDNHSLLNIQNLDIILPETPFSLIEVEKKIVKMTVDKFGGNKTKASEFLGLNRIQMYGRFKNIFK